MAGKKTTRPAAANRPQTLGAQKLLTPCNEGRNAYVFAAKTGKNPNLAVGSDAFNAAIAENVAAGHGTKVREELTELHTRFPGHGWGRTLLELETAGILPGV